MDSICWSISEPSSTASIYTESSSVENAIEDQTSVFFDAKEDGKESESSFVNLSRPLTERLAEVFSVSANSVIFPRTRLWLQKMKLGKTYIQGDHRFLPAYVLDVLDLHLSIYYKIRI